VLHFLPAASLIGSVRVASLLQLDRKRGAHGRAQAVVAGEMENVLRVRLVQRKDGPVYVLSSSEHIKALRATALTEATVRSAEEAAVLSSPHAPREGSHIASALIAAEISADQWTIGEQYDPHPPIYPSALNH